AGFLLPALPKLDKKRKINIKKLRYHGHSEVFYPFFLNGIVFCAVSCSTFNLCSKLSNRFLPSSSVINSKRTAKFISLDKPNIWVSSTSSYKGHWGVIKLLICTSINRNILFASSCKSAYAFSFCSVVI